MNLRDNERNQEIIKYNLIGTRVDPDTRKKLIDIIVQMDEVLNVSNLMLHNYGENRYIGSVDIEVDAGLAAGEISRLSHRIKKRASETGVEITSISTKTTSHLISSRTIT